MANQLNPPNKLRKLYCIDHIKQFFISIAGLELQGIDASILMQMDDEIKGVGNILIFISNFLFQFYVHNWF